MNRNRLRCASAALLLLVGACQPAPDSNRLAVEARQYRAKGELKAAVIQLKNAVQFKPADAALRKELGATYLDQGDAIAAEKELRKARTLGDASMPVIVMIGRSLIMQGKYRDALELSGESDPDLLAIRGDAQAGLGEQAEAHAFYTEALRLAPEHGGALCGKARLAIAHHDIAAASAFVQRALRAHPNDIDSVRLDGDIRRIEGKSDAALERFRRLLVLQPGNAQPHVDVANVLMDQSRFKEARAELEKARALSVGTLAVFYAHAMLDYREGRFDTALEGVQQVLRVVPDHAPSLLLLGAVQLARHAPLPAVEALGRYLAIYPADVYANKLLISAHLANDAAAEARPILSALLERAPNDADVLALAGEEAMRSRDFVRAAGYFEQARQLRPDQTTLRTAVGMSYFGSGELARAISELENATAASSRPAQRAGELLVMAYLKAHQFGKAQEAVERMEKQERLPSTLNLKGAVALARQDQAAARQAFEAALMLEPAYMPALDNLAQLDLMLKKPNDAKARYLAALAKAPRNAALPEALARLATREGKLPEAAGWLEKAYAMQPDALVTGLRLADFYIRSGDKDKALKLAVRIQGSHPSDADALDMLARAQTAQPDLPAAIESYAKLAALLPASSPALLRLAKAQLELKDLRGAQATISKLLALQPGLIEGYRLRAGIQAMQKDYAGARQTAAALQKRQPQSAAGYKFEGDAWLAEAKPVQALRAYERAFALEPGSALAVQLHASQLQSGQVGPADTRLQRWIKDNPDDAPTRLYLAGSLSLRGRYADAIAQLEAVLAKEPRNVVALNDLAWNLHQSHAANALETAQRAIAIAPDSPVVLDTLGWIIAERGDPARALPMLRKASSRLPEAAQLRFHLGVALARTGDKVGARKELEYLLAHTRDFPQQAEVKSLLASL